MQGANCTSGAIWGSASWSRSLQRAAQLSSAQPSIWTSSLTITSQPALPAELQLLRFKPCSAKKKKKCIHCYWRIKFYAPVPVIKLNCMCEWSQFKVNLTALCHLQLFMCCSFMARSWKESGGRLFCELTVFNGQMIWSHLHYRPLSWIKSKPYCGRLGDTGQYLITGMTYFWRLTQKLV